MSVHSPLFFLKTFPSFLKLPSFSFSPTTLCLSRAESDDRDPCHMGHVPSFYYVSSTVSGVTFGPRSFTYLAIKPSTAELIRRSSIRSTDLPAQQLCPASLRFAYLH